MVDWLYTRLWESRWEHLKTTSESFSFDSIVHDYSLGDIWVLPLPTFCFLNLCSVGLFHLAQTPLPWDRNPTLHSKMANSCNYPMLYFPVYHLSLLFIHELSIQFPLMSASMNRLQVKLASILALTVLCPLWVLLKGLGCSQLRCHCKYSGRAKISQCVLSTLENPSTKTWKLYFSKLWRHICITLDLP